VFDAMNIIFSYAVKGAGDTYFVFYVSIVMAVLLAATTWLAVHRWQASIYDCWLVMTLWTCLLGLLYLGRYLSGAWKSMRVTELQADQKTLGVEL
jgi:MATE family multidrug resistance protein